MSNSPTAPYTLTTYSASTGSTAAFDYKTAIDNNMLVFQRYGTNMAVSEQTTVTSRDMSVHVMPGFNFRNGVFNEIAAQDSTQIATPINGPRIDRIVADATSGLISVITGTEAASPSPPAIPAGTVPLAQLYLTPQTTRIGNSMLTDERVWCDAAFGMPADCQIFTTTGAFNWTKPINCSSNSLVRWWQWAGGGGAANTAEGGGGGACLEGFAVAGDMASVVAGSVGAGGGIGTPGGNTSFNGKTVYGGGGATVGSGGGGGGMYNAGSSRDPGSPADGSGIHRTFGGGFGSASGGWIAGNSVYGGGGGAASAAGFLDGGRSLWGGGGGAGRSGGGVDGTPGISIFGGNGGAPGVNGSAPGGGGGGSTAATPGSGARGEVRVYTWR